MTAILFGVFNAAYWPVHGHNRDTAPENFLRRAWQLEEGGKTEEAIKILEQGIDTQHPPFPEPYAALRDCLIRVERKEAAEAQAATVVFYSALAGEDAYFRGGMLQRGAAMGGATLPTLGLSDGTERNIRWLAGNLGAAYGVLDSVVNLPLKQQVALLQLAGHALSLDGTIGTTGVMAPKDILVMSGGGTGAKRMAHILLQGRDFAKPERGFHVAIIETQSGQVTQTAQFDLYARESEAQRMAHFLHRVPPGAIGMFAVCDEASVNMSAALVEELLDFGFEEQAHIDHGAALFGLRYSFAGIGVKGALPGTALQAWSPDNFAGHSGHPVVCGVLCPAASQEGGDS